VCGATCKTDAIRCIDNEPRCERATYDFESGTDGWELVTTTVAGAGKALAQSRSRPRSGSGSLAVTIQTDPIIVEWRMKRALCNPVFTDDLRGKRVSGWFYFDGASLAPNCCSCQVRFFGVPSGAMSSPFGMVITNSPNPSLTSTGFPQEAQQVRLLPMSGQWMQIQGYFPANVQYPDEWLKSPITMDVDCGMGGVQGFTWTGTVYVDDLSIR
jgi:hypothetical protein